MSDPSELQPQWLVTVTLDPESGVPQATANVDDLLRLVLDRWQRNDYFSSYTLKQVKP